MCVTWQFLVLFLYEPRPEQLLTEDVYTHTHVYTPHTAGMHTHADSCVHTATIPGTQPSAQPTPVSRGARAHALCFPRTAAAAALRSPAASQPSLAKLCTFEWNAF